MKNKIKITSREITLIIITTIVLIFFFAGYSIGKNYDKTDIITNTKIAEPILIVDNDSPIEITSENNFGKYGFKIRNYNNENKITRNQFKI